MHCHLALGTYLICIKKDELIIFFKRKCFSIVFMALKGFAYKFKNRFKYD